MEQVFNEIVQFIRELYNEPEAQIQLHTPVFLGNEKKYIEECIDSTYVSSVGKFVDQFEEGIARYTGVKKAVGCVNGTNALHLALLLVGVAPDTEVITQPLTFVATANAIKYCQADPIFLDVDLDTLGLSPKAIKNWLEDTIIVNFNHKKNLYETINKNTGRRISACVPMHTFGHPCHLDEIIEICNKYNIPVVEDAAESLGSFYRDIHTGTFGELGILSFNGNKTLTTGGGGMILTNNENLGNHIKHLTTQAKVPHPWKFVHDYIGYNYRMPNINAALGLAQLEKIEQIILNKRKIAQQYKEFFASLGINFFTEPENSRSNYWLNAIFLDNRHERDEFLRYSNERGIMTRPAWSLMTNLKMYKYSQTDDLSNAIWLANRLVCLPSGFSNKL